MNRKRYMVICAAALLLVAAVLIFALTRSEREKAEIPEPDSRYPYSLCRTKKGLLVTVEGGENGYQWNASVDNPAAAYPAERAVKGSGAEVLVLPGPGGNAEVTLSLERRDAPYDCLYRIGLRLRAEDGVLTVLSCSHQALSGAVQDGEGRYTVLSRSDGSYLISMHGSEEQQWSAILESGSAIVSWVAPETGSGAAAFPGASESIETDTCFLVAGNGGAEAVVRVEERIQGDDLLLTFSADEDGTLLLQKHEYQAGRTNSAPAETGWELPQNAVLPEFDTVSCYSQENGRSFTADRAVFLLKGKGWRLLRAEDRSRGDLAGRDYRSSDEYDGEAEETDVWYFRMDGLWCAAWDSDGRAYLLCALSETKRETVEEASAILMEQRP